MADGIDHWTGSSAAALQDALRLTNEAFAEHLGVSVRAVAEWRAQPEMEPGKNSQQILDTVYERAPEAVRKRFHNALGDTSEAPAADAAAATAEPSRRRLVHDPNIDRALEWLDHATGWSPGTSRDHVAEALAQLDERSLRIRGQQRSTVGQPELAWALAGYYGAPPAGYGRYSAHLGDTQITTTLLTSPGWLDLAAPLLGPNDGLALAETNVPDAPIDHLAADAAVTRLAEALTAGVQLVDRPLYRLQQAAIGQQEIAGQLGIDRFARYALTLDLLEAETIDALVEHRSAAPGQLPLRDRYLPDFATVLNTDERLCAGGTLALCAIARPADFLNPRPDYVLLLQERSGQVLNAARRLAVIPKGFHQPMTDYRAEARLGATLVRELEEELFGREEIDNTVTEDRHADPMHPSRLSDPMRSLLEAGTLHMECTGFGYNLVSGNYEFPALIVIDDESFWARYGGQLEANWEAAGLRQVSTLDRAGLTALTGDIAWSNEGLFAYLQGLRKLAELGGDRVDLPAIEWELR